MNLQEPLWHQLLLRIYKLKENQRYLSQIHRKLKGSMTYLRKIMQKLEEARFIRIIPNNNRKMIELTSEGEKIVIALIALKTEINSQIKSDV